ncbi:ankyrin repeat domain-containing protein 45 [Platysternon megacephalum]|uniref:Ankyrin repeat domain-containing protein 45 n=1 Tax=Platysternon megacephalum TaxID=55544 RepID=A0A4D9E2X3_9SAUR|nr:ankyrin repeat domain-containing protein 45 [Platysternon megacephalum]
MATHLTQTLLVQTQRSRRRPKNKTRDHKPWLQERAATAALSVLSLLIQTQRSRRRPKNKTRDHKPWLQERAATAALSVLSLLIQSLACVRDMDEAALRKDIGTLFPALHSMVCHLPREHLEERREALDSLVHLARLFLVKLLVFLFRRLNKDEEEETCASLFILDRIVLSNISEMTHHTEKLFIALGPILQSTSIRVREALDYFIQTMGAHGLLEKSASRPLIDFLVRQCTLTLDSTEEADGRLTMELEVHQLCSSTLQSLGDSPRMANVLWPGLLLQLSPAAHGPALPLLLQTSVGVVKRMQEEGRLPLARRCGKANRGSSPRATLPQELLARLLFLEDRLFFISDHTWLGCFIASIRHQLAYSDKRPGDKGFARALGLCARQHLYEIFAILEHWEEFVSKVQLQPSAGGSLEEPASIEQLRSLLLLTYGHVVHSGPTDLILETIGCKILSPMRQHYFLSPHEMLRGKDRARLQSPDHQHALLAVSYLGKFKPRLSKEQEAETTSTCIASTMIQRPALVKLRGTEVAEISTIRTETFLEQHLTPTTLLRLFLDLKPMAEQGYMAGLLTSQAFDAQEATRYWASQALYWLFTPCKAVVYTKTGAVVTVLSKTQKDASCRESPAHVAMTTCGLWELIGALGQADTLEGREDNLFTSCFLAIACPPARHLSGVQQDLPSDASPHSMAVQALARVLRLRGSQPAVELMDQERGWQLLEEAQPEGFTLLSSAIVTHPNLALKSIPQLLLPSLQASQEGESMACTALFVEFLGSPLLMENEPKAMRKQVRKKRDQILGSFVRAVCESCNPRAILDTMEGLCWMLRDPKVPLKAHVTVPLALQARTFFEDENSSLRRASMELFGHLSKFVSKKSSLFGAEVEKSMGTLFIHL